VLVTASEDTIYQNARDGQVKKERNTQRQISGAECRIKYDAAATPRL